MKGIMFRLFEDSVRRVHGDDRWDDILDEAKIDGVYTTLGTYPDEQLGAVLSAAARVLDEPEGAVLRWIGRESASLLQERYPRLFTGHADTRSFLRSVEDTIHPHVRRQYRDAEPPLFQFEDLPDGTLEVVYSSERGMCALAEGLIEGCAPLFGEEATVVQPSCRTSGDPACTLHATFARVAP